MNTKHLAAILLTLAATNVHAGERTLDEVLAINAASNAARAAYDRRPDVVEFNYLNRLKAHQVEAAQADAKAEIARRDQWEQDHHAGNYQRETSLIDEIRDLQYQVALLTNRQ